MPVASLRRLAGLPAPTRLAGDRHAHFAQRAKFSGLKSPWQKSKKEPAYCLPKTAFRTVALV
jgi:hypothetical protein